ncbi:hypothetical protein JJO83_16230 [Halomonas aquamarina]|uniref:hypothetical protein n=1 Tax=Vreelandella aquamarina TaxID=77097 RepID=UPI00235A28CB|nr:hypothetical protein [Halomonas aquamarina]MDC8444219.1 hypothetical protein [Halomonas aquamarina]
MEALLDEYGRILKELKFDSFNHNEDKYSGVFLPVPFDEYWSSSLKVMLVGRETAGWNTDNQKNTIKRVAEFAENNKISDLVQEATGRYKRHLPVSKNGKVITKTRSRFKQYFFRLAKELEVNPESIIYGNLFAWDYNKKSPRTRPKNELKEITEVSKKLLAAQIRCLRPDVIIFATGFVGVDQVPESVRPAPGSTSNPLTCMAI